MSDEPQAAISYWKPPEENPNFQSRAPDPGAFNFYKTLGQDALYHSPISSINRLITSSDARRGIDPDNPWAPYSELHPKMLEAKEANDRFGMGGQLHFDEPISEQAATLMAQRKVQQNDRDYLISSGSNSGLRKAAGMGVGMAASILDPVNLGSMFIPVLGEERIAAMAARFGGGKIGQRIIQGGLTGLSAQAELEPLILLANHSDQEGYTLMDSAKNLGFGLTFGALIHAGLGAVADHILSLKPADSAAIFETAMNDVLNDRPSQNAGKVAEFAEHVQPGPDAIRLKEGTILTNNTEHSFPDWLGNMPENVDVESAEYGHMENGQFISHVDPEGAEFQREKNQQESDSGTSYVNVGDRIVPVDEAQHLQELDQQTRNQQAVTDRTMKVNEMTRTESPREPKIDRGIDGDMPKDEAEVTRQIEDLKKQAVLPEEEQKQLEERIKSEVGDQAGRSEGIQAAVNCVTRNLI